MRDKTTFQSEKPTALILAAGLGTRLRPLTLECPKPLIPVAGVEALFFALYRVSMAGLRKVIVNSHHLPEHITKALVLFRALFPELEIHESYEEKILGTAGGIFKVIQENDLPAGLLVLNGDTLGGFSLKGLFNANSSFCVSYEKKYFQKYNPVFVDKQTADWRGLKQAEGLRPGHFLGAHFLSPEDLLLFKSETVREIDLFSGIYSKLSLAGKKITALEVPDDRLGFWFDLTSREFLNEAALELSAGKHALWKDVLRLRHPKLSYDAALRYWPLQNKP